MKAPIADGLYKWSVVSRIKQFPKDIADITAYLYIFSPNLQYYLDFDQNDSVFIIKKT